MMPKRQPGQPGQPGHPTYPDLPRGGGCAPIATERNRYFTGKYMTARDFADEQRYFLSRHRLHNRLLHGWGIACGLGVVEHPDKACAGRWVVVRAGIAIDCCGREVILARDTPFRLPLPWPEATGQPCTITPCGEHEGEPGMDGPFLLCLRYRESRVEYMPVLYGECCDDDRKEANRIEECAEIVVCTLDEVRGCWGGTDDAGDTRCRDDCEGGGEARTGGCLDADCACGETVPLALVRFDPQDQAAGYAIEVDGRTELGETAVGLTRIVETTWTHGATVGLATVRDGWNGQLRVRFDRKLRAADDEATGINQHTFVVQYGGVQRDLEFLEAANGFPCVDPDDDCVAVFEIDPGKLRPDKRQLNIAGNVVYITLRGDFVLDCRGNPVDGDHLRGRLPTGDGIPGGTFESWFRVTYDDAGNAGNQAAG